MKKNKYALDCRNGLYFVVNSRISQEMNFTFNTIQDEAAEAVSPVNFSTFQFHQWTHKQKNKSNCIQQHK